MFFDEENAKSIVMEPTLPNIIRKQSNKLEITPRPGVIPTLRPTVAIAETVSNNASKKAMFSICDMTIAVPQEKIR